MEFDPTKFTAFIRAKYKKYLEDHTGRESLSDYARYLGINQPVVNDWWNGKLKRRPSPEMYGILVGHYGTAAYEALALPVPDPVSLRVLPPDLRDRVEAYLVDLAEILRKESIDPESTRAETVAREILEKHGFRDISNT